MTDLGRSFSLPINEGEKLIITITSVNGEEVETIVDEKMTQDIKASIYLNRRVFKQQSFNK